MQHLTPRNRLHATCCIAGIVNLSQPLTHALFFGYSFYTLVMPLIKKQMFTEKEAHEFANHWVQAWNSHDLDEIMSHYATDVVLVSPVAAKLLNDSSGTVKGREALRAYFT